MEKTEISKRKYEGLVWAWIVKQSLRESKYQGEALEMIISKLEKYKFVGRKETDLESHRNSKPVYLEDVPDDSTVDEIVTAIITLGESLFNANKANSLKKYCLKELRNVYKDFNTVNDNFIN